MVIVQFVFGLVVIVFVLVVLALVLSGSAWVVLSMEFSPCLTCAVYHSHISAG